MYLVVAIGLFVLYSWYKRQFKNWNSQFLTYVLVGQLTLGEGFRVNYIGVGAIDLENASGDSLLELINPNINETWLFTLDLDGEPRIFLTVALEKGKYQVVGYGGNSELFVATRVSFDSQIEAKGASIAPVLVKAGARYFFIAKVADEEFVLPVGGLGETYNTTDSGRLLPASEVVEFLKHFHGSMAPGERSGNAALESLPSSGMGKSLGQGIVFAAVGLVFIGITFIVRRGLTLHNEK